MEVNLPMMNLEREMTSSAWIKRWMSLSKRYTSLHMGEAAERRALLVLLEKQLEAWQELFQSCKTRGGEVCKLGRPAGLGKQAELTRQE